MKPVQNPPNPFLSHDRVYLEGVEPPARLQVFEEKAKSILSKNDSPDLGFRWSLNPYRGCTHGCIYCYARPTHEYLGFGAGSDFDTKIVAKINAPELLRQTFQKKSWKNEMIIFSGDTDCYQPLEVHYKLTQRCLEACLDFDNPAGLITKSFLITRDTALLQQMAQRQRVSVIFSIPFADEKNARIVEPFAASIAKRFEALKMLSKAGIPTGVNIAPVIPGLNDSDIPLILKKAKACGALSASYIPLRLPGPVKDVFIRSIEKHFPLASGKILSRIRQIRGGKLNDSHFGSRFEGKGAYWRPVEDLFRLYVKKLDLNREIDSGRPAPPFRSKKDQMEFQF